MRDKYDIFDFEVDERMTTGRKVISVWIKLENGERFHLCFLTDYQLDDLAKLRKELE